MGSVASPNPEGSYVTCSCIRRLALSLFTSSTKRSDTSAIRLQLVHLILSSRTISYQFGHDLCLYALLEGQPPDIKKHTTLYLTLFLSSRITPVDSRLRDSGRVIVCYDAPIITVSHL